ncbi:helix-turn-helix domain-containing protein [Sphingomonas qilianensis]|uniref:Helix-turn-helix domain-containing protein n=1 Tax=Sphingomonas qilianensis TaxID=1736690 RepID=A0ABU9XWQ5_9SPHN
MSLQLMRAAWSSGLPPIDRLVLVALADWANERGSCWPSMPTIANKTGVDVRTARRVMKRLEEGGHITTNRRTGKVILYTIHPGHSDPGHTVPGQRDPGQPAPRTENALTPDTVSPNTSRTTIKRKKTSSSPSGESSVYPMPEGVDRQAWTDFLANRKRKRLSNTVSAHKTLMDDLARHASAAWPVARLIAHAAGKGWASVRNPDGDNRDSFMERTGPSGTGLRGARPDPALDLYLAGEAELAAERACLDQEADRRAWPALSALGGS